MKPPSPGDPKRSGDRKTTDLRNKMANFWQRKSRFSLWYFLVVVIGLAVLNFILMEPSYKIIDYSEFKDKVASGEIKRVRMTPDYFYGYPRRSTDIQGSLSNNFQGGPSTQQPFSPSQRESAYKTVPLPLYDPELLALFDEKSVEIFAEKKKNNVIISSLLSWVVPMIILVLIWRLLMKRLENFGGSNVMSFGQNRSRIVADDSHDTRFGDVAGCEEAKEELAEVVDFLKFPKKYANIGGRIPRGVLLVGPPGTGKTLLARAVAGEASVTFFRMSGADFVEMFVGVGAARVRDLFNQARGKAPCIIFIDELDAIGKVRVAGVQGGNDEREQTLNQLLVEMDGFDTSTGVILLAATNRPEVLDPALLRPGRFDRQVLVDRPDLLGREAILKIHSKQVKIDPSVDLADVAKATPGFVGADLANVINEAALLAVRAKREVVQFSDFNEAIEKLMAGLEKKNRLINPREREIVAYHETGHALVAAFTPDSDPVQKISIVPRGMGALGYTLQTPIEDRFLMTEDELLGRINVLLGGRAAEMITYKKFSTGAANDIMKATDIARNLITEYGMSKKFRNVALTQKPGSQFSVVGIPHREYAETTQQYVDEEIAQIVDRCYEKVLSLLTKHRALLTKIAEYLLEKEVLSSDEFIQILEKDPKGNEELRCRREADMTPSESALKHGQKRNEEILARLERQRKEDEARQKEKEEAEAQAQAQAEKKKGDSDNKVDLEEIRSH